MATRKDIIGAVEVLRSAGIDIVGNRNPDQGDFGYGGVGMDDEYDNILGMFGGDDDDDDGEVTGADIIGAVLCGARNPKNLTRKQKRILKDLSKKKQKSQQNQEFQQLASAFNQASKPSVRTSEDYVLRGLTLGLGSVVVPGPGVESLDARAQEAIRIQRIELDPNGASFANLFITSIVVGVRPQSANLQEMPLIAFAFNATGSYLRGNTVDKGQDFQVNLRSALLVNTTITGVVFGDSLQP